MNSINSYNQFKTFRRKFYLIQRFIYSSYILKTLNLLLFLFLINDIPRILIIIKEWHLYFKSFKVSEPVRNELQWMNIDILKPPNLNSLVYEKVRINEFLAFNSFSLCKNKSLIGGKIDSFYVCLDNYFTEGSTNSDNFKLLSYNNASDTTLTNRKALLITSRNSLINDFEKQLNISRWSLFLPQNSSGIDKLQGDIDIYYFSTIKNSLSNSDLFPINYITNNINNMHYYIAKIDFTNACSNTVERCKPSKLLDKIVAHFTADQLMIIIKLSNNEFKDLADWYRTFFKLFFQYNYAIIGVQRRGSCTANFIFFDQCEYRISFMRKKPNTVFDIIPFGLGTPLEEKFRLLNYFMLMPTNKDCIKNDIALFSLQYSKMFYFPIPCHLNNKNKFNNHKVLLKDIKKTLNCSSIVYFRYRLIKGQQEWNMLFAVYKFICTHIHIYYPYRIDKKISILSEVKLHPFGISPNDKLEYVPSRRYSNKFKQEFWHLNSFQNLIMEAQILTYLPNILIFDLDGGEWSVFNTILKTATAESHSCALLRNFEQIVILLRLWAIEEALNYRRFYFNFLRLENECGFIRVKSDQINISTLLIIFKREKILV